MLNYQIYPYQNDLLISKLNIDKKKINIYEKRANNTIYKTILFYEINNNLLKVLTKEILFFFKESKLKKTSHIFIVGLGNEYHTPDSIGPNTLKSVRVNAYLENLGMKIKDTKVSALKPGVLGQTGILTEKTIESMTKEIKPDLVILIDSFVSDDINYLNHTIQLNNYGISPGIGLKGVNSTISKKNLQVPVLVIGVTTSLLIKLANNKTNYVPYILSTKDIDEYVVTVSKLIGRSINKAINKL